MTLGWDNPTADPTTTILLRHGDTRLSPEHRFSGLRDLPLSASGTRQARAAACRLATGSVKPTSVTGTALPWQKSSSDGPQLRQPGGATPNRHPRAGRASPRPHTG